MNFKTPTLLRGMHNRYQLSIAVVDTSEKKTKLSKSNYFTAFLFQMNVYIFKTTKLVYEIRAKRYNENYKWRNIIDFETTYFTPNLNINDVN